MNRIEQLRSFLAETPGDNFLTHALALEYIKQGNDTLALEQFLTNLESNPLYIATYYHLGKLYERMGETQKAIDIYQSGMDQARLAGDNHAYSELRSVYEELIW